MEEDTLIVCPVKGCEVPVGDRHKSFCTMARCKEHGFQLFSCPLDDPHTPSIFRGEFPGTSEAIARGWFSRFDENKGWVACQSDHPDAMPDLNRVMSELVWNSDSESFGEVTR